MDNYDMYRVTNGAEDNAVNVANGLFKGLIPELGGNGPIKGLEALADAVHDAGNAVIKFGAGLPDHKRPEQVKDELATYSKKSKADYARYQRERSAEELEEMEREGEKLEKNITEEAVLPALQTYHRDVMGIVSPTNRFVLTEGSTPALNHLIRMQALKKAKDKKALGENCVLELFDLTYPLYRLAADQYNIEVTQGIKLQTELDIQDGKPIQAKPWALNRESLQKSFEANREKVAVFAFCNPANPSGHKFSVDEMDFLADELLKDFQIRKDKQIAPKLVMEDVAYITMMHDDHDRPYTLVHALSKKIAQERAKDQPDQALIQQLIDCKQTVVTVHSLSKAAAEAGDRVAYTEGHPDIVGALREVYTNDMLSYANSTLHAARGAYAAGAPDRKVMREYSTRVTTFEKGMNDAYFNMMDAQGFQLDRTGIQNSIPFPSVSSGTFFTVMNMKPLLGQKVDTATMEKAKAYIAGIADDGLRASVGKVYEDGMPIETDPKKKNVVFENGVITNEKDISLYFMLKTLEKSGTAISSVPINGTGMLRFSMGNTPIKQVNQAVKAATQFFTEDPNYLAGVAAMQKTPETAVSGVFSVDKLGVAKELTVGAR